MATTSEFAADDEAKPGPSIHSPHKEQEIRLFSHSDVFYWWPVWALGFLLAFVTYLDGGRLAIVPAGTEARRDWRVEVAPSRVETREGLLLPRPADGHVRHLLPAGGPTTAGTLPAPEQPHVRIAGNPYLGTWFLITILVVFVSTHAPLRGIWQWVAVLAIALVISIIATFGWWGHLVDWFGLLHVQINMAGYFFLSTWLFAVWAVTFFYFDRLTYLIFSTGQVRVRQAIGEGEKVYDVTNLNLELQPNVFFRHRVLGFYDAGDLIVRTGGARPEVLLWPNVLLVRSRLRKIERLVQTREVE